MKNTTTAAEAALEIKKLLWIRRHRGSLSAIARELGCHPRSVSQVYWGIITSRRITEALKKRGAPIEVVG